MSSGRSRGRMEPGFSRSPRPDGIMRWIAVAAVGLVVFAQERRTAFDGNMAGEQRTIAGVLLRWCPAGQFRMGSPPDEPGHRPDEKQVDVRLSRGFWIGQYEVT